MPSEGRVCLAPDSGPGIVGTWYIIAECNMRSGLVCQEPFLWKHNVAFRVTDYKYQSMWGFPSVSLIPAVKQREAQLWYMWTQPITVNLIGGIDYAMDT